MTYTPDPDRTKARATLTTWRKAAAIIAPEDRRKTGFTLAVVVIAALAAALMVASVLPFLAVLSNANAATDTAGIAWVADTLGLTDPYDVLIAVGMGSLGLIIIASATQVWKLVVMERFAAGQAYTINQRLMRIYLGKPYSFFLDRHGTDMATILLAEVGEAVAFFIRPAMEMIAAFFTLTAIALLMIWVSPGLALAVFSIIGGAFGLTYLITRRFVREQGKIRAQSNALRYRITHEAFDGIKEVKVMGLEHRYHALAEAPTGRMVRAIISLRIASQLPRSIIYALASGGVILLCLYLVPREAYLSGTGLGEVVPTLGMFALAAQRLIPELQRIYGASNELQYGTAAIDRLYNDFAGAIVPDLSQTTPQVRLTDSFALDGVGYTYPNAARAGLQDISLAIKAGEKVGIVGSTGAGKTTLADIILGLLTPQSGSITVDGQTLTEATTPGWQASVGYVPQDIYLTDTTVAQNIAFGSDAVDITRVKEAAHIANIAELIETELPDGYNTTLGERGVRLSGGQRQRMGIARAVYRNADMIVFDEATSALDTLTEGEIMEAINALPRTKTLILIAHRLSTLATCDRIIVLDQGRVAAVGPWDELETTSPTFQALLNGTRAAAE